MRICMGAMDDDEEIIRDMIDRGLVTAEQVEECRKARSEITALGDPSLTLTDLLALKGYLRTPETAAEDSKRLGPYFLDRKLGHGGMGVVYQARDGARGPVVALKVLSAALSADPEYVARFRREAGIALRVSHPNLVKGLGIGCAGDRWFYAMEFIDGEQLSQAIDARGRFAEGETVGVAVKIALALNEIHRHGLIHRDVHPSNVLLTRQGDVKLMDLGLAKPTWSGTSEVTRLAIRLGTPNFTSPEQFNSEKDLDIRTDLFSLGATMYNMATGHKPFEGATAMEVVNRRMRHDLDDPRRFRPDLSEPLRAAILKAMAQARRDRYATPADMLADLQRMPGAVAR
jgi:serine/threonine protein kinase